MFLLQTTHIVGLNRIVLSIDNAWIAESDLFCFVHKQCTIVGLNRRV